MLADVYSCPHPSRVHQLHPPTPPRIASRCETMQSTHNPYSEALCSFLDPFSSMLYPRHCIFLSVSAGSVYTCHFLSGENTNRVSKEGKETKRNKIRNTMTPRDHLLASGQRTIPYTYSRFVKKKKKSKMNGKINKPVRFLCSFCLCVQLPNPTPLSPSIVLFGGLT